MMFNRTINHLLNKRCYSQVLLNNSSSSSAINHIPSKSLLLTNQTQTSLIYTSCKSLSQSFTYSSNNNNNNEDQKPSFVPPPPPPSSSSSSSTSTSSTSFVPPPSATATETTTTTTTTNKIYDDLDLSYPTNIVQLRKELLDRVIIAKESIDITQEKINMEYISRTFLSKEEVAAINKENQEPFEKAKSLYLFGMYDQAFNLFTTTIDPRHGMTNVFLGNMYLTGTHVEKNEERAFHYFTLASQARVPVAIGVLGEMYLKGQHVLKNETQARSYFDLAASYGLRSSTEQLLYMVMNSVGGVFNLKKAIYYLKHLALLGDDRSYSTMGSLIYDIQKGLAVELWKFGSRLGNFDCMHYLGRHYYSRENPDYNLSLALWERSANEGGHPESQFYLGSMYEMGLIVPRDTEHSFELYMRSAKQGNVDAQYLVGKGYAEGYGTIMSQRSARYWFKKAADQGDERAKQMLKSINQSILALDQKLSSYSHSNPHSKLGKSYKSGGSSSTTTTTTKYFRKNRDNRDNIDSRKENGDKDRDRDIAPKIFKKTSLGRKGLGDHHHHHDR